MRARRLLSVIVIIVLSLTVAVPGFAATPSDRVSITTPADYANYLEAQASFDAGALEALDEFLKLDAVQQKAFVRYLNDPAIAKAMHSVFGDQVERIELYDGDVVVSADIYTAYVDDDGFLPMSTLHLRATYYRWVTFLGIKVFETTSWVQYYHDGSQVLSITGYNHYVSRNISLWSITFSGMIGWGVGESYAQSRTDMVWNIIWEGLGLVYSSGELGVWGNYTTAGGWYYPN